MTEKKNGRRDRETKTNVKNQINEAAVIILAHLSVHEGIPIVTHSDP
jgi:hypothetical protein